jgi:hypothetical protein
LDLNAKIKATNNTSIKACQKANKNYWSDSPTAGHATDSCESSMFVKKWIFASNWMSYHVSKFRWLVVHLMESGVKEHSCLNYWSDKEDSLSEDEYYDQEKKDELEEDPISQSSLGLFRDAPEYAK